MTIDVNHQIWSADLCMTSVYEHICIDGGKKTVVFMPFALSPPSPCLSDDFIAKKTWRGFNDRKSCCLTGTPPRKLHTLIGYALVSTDDQNFDLQFDALIKAGCERF